MRSVFRLLGGIRLVLGALIVAIALTFQNYIGEIWTIVLVLIGTAIGTSGTVSVYLGIAWVLAFPFAMMGLMWLMKDFWRDVWFSDFIRGHSYILYFYWIIGLVSIPIHIWYDNQSWLFMVRKFGLDQRPVDTKIPELHSFVVVDLTCSQYFEAFTITDQGIILDRRNFAPVILPWRWVESITPAKESPRPAAVVAMKNDNNDYLTLDVPWNEDILKLNPNRLGKGGT